VGALLVELGRIEPAHVVRFEDVRVEHAVMLLGNPRRSAGVGRA
jgi:hypothetical protein